MPISKPIRLVHESLNAVRFVPHWVIFRNHPARRIIEADIRRWLWVKHEQRGVTAGLVYLLTYYPEFRSLFYFRIGPLGSMLRVFAAGMPTLIFGMPRDAVGPGLFIQHGFATVISARRLGRECWINQQVTIGYTDETSCPTIGDRVTIGAGAIVIGDISVGTGTVVGANSVVVKDTPPGVVVAGVPARVIRASVHLP